jgi:hypothetical protein
MAINLIRNSRLLFTTAVDSTSGKVGGTTASATNTFEIQVLDGFSFSQNSNNETVTVSEAGTTPARGQRSFNTSLAPVDFSFSTYIRPKLSSTVNAEESVLWNALFSPNAIAASGTTVGTISATTVTGVTYVATAGTLTINGTGLAATSMVVGDSGVISGVTGMTTNSEGKYLNAPATVTAIGTTAITFQLHNPYTTSVSGTLTTSAGAFKFFKQSWVNQALTVPMSVVSSAVSNTNNLQKFAMVVFVDNVTYAIENCVLTQATIDFGLDGIATVQWTGQATALREINTTISGNTLSGTDFSGTAASRVTDAKYITNKLSTVSLKAVNDIKDAGGTTKVAAGAQYYLALTGGSLTINNNVSYLTPANLGIVNTPITYFTGTRSISGTFNAYLNTGTISQPFTNVNGDAATTLTKGTGALLKDLLDAATGSIEPMFALEIAIGGVTNALRVECQMPSASIGIPAINTEQVVSTTISFNASPSTWNSTTLARVYDITESNEITLRYYCPA